MTDVLVDLSVPDPSGVDAPAEGVLYCTPTRRRDVDGRVVLPASFSVDLVGGMAVLPLAPTGPDWCWQIQEATRLRHTRFVVVPDSATPVLYTALVDVDPGTLDPSESSVPAWEAAVGEVAAIRDEVAALAQGAMVNVRQFGGFEAASTWQQNRDALQAANDEAAAMGGATVILPPGIHPVKGVIQDSHVTIRGTGTTLAHPDGLTGHMIEARRFTTTGTIAAGSSDLTVASATGIEVGTVAAVTGARGMSDRQNTLLAAAIDATQTTGITLSNTYAFPGAGYLTIGSEVIQYTGMSSGTLTGVTRGALGTTAAAHGTTGPADAIGISAHHIAQVVAVNGTTVTLDRPAAAAVTNAPVTFGIVDPGIYGIRFEGNRQEAGASVHYPVFWQTVGNGHGDKIYAHRAQSSIFLGLGATGNHFGTVVADNCMLQVGIGAAFWMFQSCRGNSVQDLRVIGRVFIGVYIDDRTTMGSPYDGPGESNHVAHLSIDVPVLVPMNQLTEHTIGLLVSGGHRNTIGTFHASGVRTAIVFERGGQSQTWNAAAPSCDGNAVAVFRGRDLYQPWVIDAPGNAVVDADFKAYLAYGVMTGNPYIGHMVGPNGEEVLKFPSGSVQFPGIAFRDEPGLGFFRQAAGMMQSLVGGKAVTRWTSEGMRMEANMALLFATDNTTDIGRITSLRPRDVRAARYVTVGALPTTGLTTPAVAGVGALVYDSTRGKVILSNGVAWVNLDGTAL